IYFELINNDPFSFTANPKEYSAYCKETIQLTVKDVTQGGVDPIVYIWPTNPTPPVEVYDYTVNASPDWVDVGVKDLCGNDTTMQIKINNKPIKLKGIQSIFLCGPGQEAVPVQTIIPNPDDMPGYSIDHVVWQRQTPPPVKPLGDQDGDEITVVYDTEVGDAVWTCWYQATDVCGGKADSVFTVNQSSLVLDNTGVCGGETIELTTGTPAHWYKWYRRDGSNWTLVGESQTTYDDTYPSNQPQINYKLEIEDNCGEFQSAEMTVFVDIYEPEISYTPQDELCMGDEITLEANESQTSQVTYTWLLGSDVVGTERTLTLGESDYQVPGTYTYILQTVSQSQYFYCTNSTEAEFTVYANPSSAFSIDPPDNACTNTNILFDYNDDITNKSFLWDFGDGTTSTQPNTVHQYANPGTYNVNLNVDLTYPSGHVCSSDSTFILKVDPLPSPDFTADVLEGCLPVEVRFQDQSADVASGATYEWTFGDGNTSDQQNPVNQYNTAGLFTVSLTVHNTDRCAATTTKPNYIQANPNPVAKFEADPWITTLDTPDIDFSDFSESDSTIINFEWDFGDGSTSNEENPTHTYQQAGEYEVTLYVETINGCVDTTIGKVALTEEVKLFFPNAFTPNGDGMNDVFEIKGTPITNFHLYIYDRWGKEIWSTHNFENRWDGTDFNGKPVPAGTYIYTITGTDYMKRDLSFKGTVTVVK
ncbi:MAG: PKD domain-containing protein, partial [Chlorobi bacterium]|nr:PKD domain-containing protein [Chlorobiota bacterium]